MEWSDTPSTVMTIRAPAVLIKRETHYNFTASDKGRLLNWANCRLINPCAYLTWYLWLCGRKRDSCHYFQIAGGRCDHVSHGFPLHCSALKVRHIFFSITKILLLASRVSGRSLTKGTQHLEEKPTCRAIGGTSHNKAAEAKRFLAGQRSSDGAGTVLCSVVLWWSGGG